MRKALWIPVLACVICAGLGGCGGFSGPFTSSITGTVLDIDNNPVRDAKVWTDDALTFTSPTGAYVLENVRAGEVRVQAEIFKNGVRYLGVNWTLDFENEVTQSVNIIVGVASEAAHVHGVVKDREGFLLENVSVYAYNGAGSSARTFTNADGVYLLSNLLPDYVYTISATARTFRSDQEDVVLSARESRTLNFVLGNAGSPFMEPPTGVEAVSWVSPGFGLAGRGFGVDAIEYVKSQIDPRREAMATGEQNSQAHLPVGTLVEVDVFWDDPTSPDLLGFGIYRANSAFGALSFLDFLADPLAGYYVDMSVGTASTYSYAVTAIATDYPAAGSESELSDRVVVDTLAPLTLLPPSFGPLTFRWQAGSLASEYIVFLFEEFPGVGVDVFWSNELDPAFGTSYVYNGPGLVPGKTYYYLVLGVNGDWSARTITAIDSFLG
ncbi:MAG: carboxypeptidase regulatory-like domain-containing protein [Armatimonadetes bacterium]|nr:carboxypeptidase regulatory-like domain-containing protein [Armatimonadota bacterium]